jgi:hypothetical protein
MIRFRCPRCGQALKAPEGKAGAAVVCPRCQRRCVAPPGTPAPGQEDDPLGHEARGGAVAHQEPEESPSLFSGMSRGWRCVVALVAGLTVLILLLALVGPQVSALEAAGGAAGQGAVPLVVFSTVVVLVILHGHGTGCPACGRWWTRRRHDSEFVDREQFDKDGVPFARAKYRTTYECASCRHQWSVTSTDEYKDFISRDRPKRRRLG